MSVEILTFGCRLNSYESELIKKSALEAKVENTIIFNSCSVTSEAERQLQQAIRKAKRQNPDKKIIVTGCAVQVNADKYLAMPEVDSVLGNEEKTKTTSYLQLATQNAIVNDIMSVKETALQLIDGFEHKARAFLQVQNGCNHRCTFCMIPYGRGNSRSVPIGEIVAQSKHLVANGYKEIVLTGVDITDYGLDLPGAPSLGQMVRRLLNLVPELPRLRLSSIDVAEIDDELFSLIVGEPRFMPHLHLSLQSGDDMILKRMKRRHTRNQILEFCKKVRVSRPDVAFGADIIAGFPTETDEMFTNTLNIVNEANLVYLHVFPYSERDGTPAARMPQVNKPIRKERAKMLRKAGEINLAKHLQTLVGSHQEVIVENDNFARAKDYSLVKLNESFPSGSIQNVVIASCTEAHLIAA